MNQANRHQVALADYFDELLNDSTEKLLQEATESTYQDPEQDAVPTNLEAVKLESGKLEPMYVEPVEALVDPVNQPNELREVDSKHSTSNISEVDIAASNPPLEDHQAKLSQPISTAKSTSMDSEQVKDPVLKEPEVDEKVDEKFIPPRMVSPDPSATVTQPPESVTPELKVAEPVKPELKVVPDSIPQTYPEPTPEQEPVAPAEVETSTPEPELKQEIAVNPAVETDKKPKDLKYPNAPEWAQYPFECLLFDVSGLTLAVPMVQLGGIIEMENEELSSLFGQPNWHLGLHKSDDVTLGVVDTAHLIMPEQNLDLRDQQITHCLRLEKSDWGLGCIGIKESVTLSPDEVRWRSKRANRPWLYGTVIDHMCALLDVTEVISLLEKGSKPAA